MINFLCSSIGKKLIMSLSGLFLLIFLALHLALNFAALISRELYDSVCAFMDTNLLVQILVPVWAGGFIVHILFSMFIEFNNWTARPREIAYCVPNKTKATSWASKNMFALGIIVICFLLLHLCNFWAHMQLQHFIGGEGENAYDLLVNLFRKSPFRLYYCVLYVAWFCAIYYHVSHGFWSAFQTIGLNNSVWLPRLQCLAKLYAAVIFLGYSLVPVCVYCGWCD